MSDAYWDARCSRCGCMRRAHSADGGYCPAPKSLESPHRRGFDEYERFAAVHAGTKGAE